LNIQVFNSGQEIQEYKESSIIE